MSDLKIKFKENIRHVSIRKKTASRICSAQVIYGFSFLNNDINLSIKIYKENYLPAILKELNLQKLDYELFDSNIRGVYENVDKIDELISQKLSSNWSFERLSVTEKSILRLATYELLYEKKFNKLTIINEYISIIEVFGGNPDFANGILDNISREI